MADSPRFRVLKVKLSRDYASKFLSRGAACSGTDWKSGQNSSRVRVTPRWSTLGRFDNLTISAIPSLAEIDPTAIEDARDLNLGSVSQLLLFPLGDEEVGEDLARFLFAEKHSHRFLVLVYFTLSAVSHEQGDNQAATLEVIRSAAHNVGASVPEKIKVRSQVFSTFGAPDFAFVGLADLASELRDVMDWVQQCQALEIKDVLGGSNDGHLFSSVVPVISFSSAEHVSYATEDFLADEIASGLRMRFRMRLDCGHRARAIGDIQSLLASQNVKLEGVSCDEFSLVGTLERFSDLARLSTKIWFDPEWRLLNLIDTETTVILSDGNANDITSTAIHSGGWQLQSKVLQELDEIRSAFEYFANTYLCSPQSTELLGLYQSFRSCFFRHALLGAGRDLLPFFRQLAYCFRESSCWEDYFTCGESMSDDLSAVRLHFSEEMRRLLNYAGRAVRNRIDFRSLPPEMPFPHTLDHGACKLVGAYSTVLYIAWELFRRRTGTPVADRSLRGDECTAHNYGACLCSGVEGTIVCTELFRPVRRQLESSPVQSPWTSRLLLVDVSGAGLLCPEFSFVHCLHEAAETSSWIESEQTIALRTYIHAWLRFVVSSYIVDVAFPKERSLISDEDRALVYDVYASGMVGAALMSKMGAANEDELAETVKFMHPEAFVELIEESFLDFVDGSVNGHHDGSQLVQKCVPDCELPAFEAIFFKPPVSYRKELSRKMFHLRQLVREIVADIGMWCGFVEMPCSAIGDLGNEFERIKHVNTIFASIVRLWAKSAADATKSKGEFECLLLRWKIQVMGVSNRSRFADGDLWNAWVNSSIQHSLSHLYREEVIPNGIRAASGSIGEFLRGGTTMKMFKLNQLSNYLRKFRPYGGMGDLEFPADDDFSPAEILVFESFSKIWKSSQDSELFRSSPRRKDEELLDLDRERVQFLTSLWAKSIRLRYGKALESRN